LFTVLLLTGATLVLTADVSAEEAEPAAKPAPWHVENADLRVTVKVDVKSALLRMPPQVYIADLKTLETTDGLFYARSWTRRPRG
jgi:hypothetical protein